MTPQKQITIPALKRIPLKELQKKYSWIKGIEKDDSTEKAVIMDIKNIGTNGNATGKDVEAVGSNLGIQHMLWLYDNQDDFPELFAEAEKENWWYLLFPATIVVDEDGSRSVPCLFQSGTRWDGNWGWLDDSFDSDGRVAVGQGAGTRKINTLDTLTLSALEKRIGKLESIVQKLKDALYEND